MKIISIVSFLLFFSWSHSLFSFYVGNPSNPAITNSGLFSHGYLLKGSTGYLYDYTTVKQYHAPQTEKNFNPNATFKEFGIHSQMASFSLILIERLEIFGYAGGSKEQTQGKTHPSILFDFESQYQFSWAAGSKVVLLQWGGTSLGCDFTYFAVPSSPKSFFQYFNRVGLPIDFGKQKISLEEWQINAGLTTRISLFAPYIGGTYLHSNLHVASSPETGSINYENEKKWGYFFGLTVSLTGKFHINLERRQKNESAYSLATIAVF
ncbi:MAG TPA: hypothetical protein VJK48_07015 [Chlamydiales bacterium]|nr:hypothetical protein [Chlamydiales bacterium]